MTNDNVLCRICKNHMRFIGPTIQVPAKSKTKEWKQLEIDISNLRLELHYENEKQKVEKRHELEKRSDELKSRPKSEGLDSLIREFERKIATLK